jgi:hypothetical protein
MKLLPVGRIRPARIALLAAVLALVPAATALAAPTVTTSPVEDPTFVTDTYAFVGGIVNPNGEPTSYQFQYGQTTAYGLTTPVTSAANGKADVPVSVSLDDLEPNTTYHYRLVAFPDPSQSAYYGVAQTAGEDQTFTTTSSLAVAFASKKSTFLGKKAFVKLTAIGPPGDVAKGRLTLKAKIKVGKKKKAKLRRIGSASYSVTVGKTKTIQVTLSRAARKLIAKQGSLKATASAKTSGIKTPVTAKLTIKA